MKIPDLYALYTHYGQSVWLGFERSFLRNGTLKTLTNRGVRGFLTNPPLFLKSITYSEAYDDALRELIQSRFDIDAEALYQSLIVQDAQAAADMLEIVYECSEGNDGYVSVDLSPCLANDRDGIIRAARQLARTIDRPNLMIKVFATHAGLSAMRQLIAEGININMVLLCTVSKYREAVESYLHGVDASDNRIGGMSIASFHFASTNCKVDARLERINTPEAQKFKGKYALASACLAYRAFGDSFYSDTFKSYARRGARKQRLLWDSSNSLNQRCSNSRFINRLIGKHTIKSMPQVSCPNHESDNIDLTKNLDRAEQYLESIQSLGIDLDGVGEELSREAIAELTDCYDALIKMLERKQHKLKARFNSSKLEVI